MIVIKMIQIVMEQEEKVADKYVSELFQEIDDFVSDHKNKKG